MSSSDFERSLVVSAGQYPTKTLRHLIGKDEIHIEPTHIMIYPESRCQLSCSYCSSKYRKMGSRLPLAEFSRIFYLLDAAHFNIKAVTFSGGGEAFLHPQLDEVCRLLSSQGIKLGAATNGVNLKDISPGTLDLFTWVRVSMDSERETIPRLPGTKAKISFTWLYQEGDEDNAVLQRLIGMAQKGEIHHLRIGEDIFHVEGETKIASRLFGIPRVFPQERSQHTKGAKRCWVALLRPLIGVDGNFYPCCGTQYALGDKMSFVYPSELNLGGVEDYIHRVNTQIPFDGSCCEVCYFDQTNKMLDVIKRFPEVEDKEFV